MNLDQLKPNELGEIPILEYHLIGDEEGRWERRTDHFRADLERLYQLGYRLVPLTDVLDDKINLPAGLSPVVLTFDDSSHGQFQLIEIDGQLVPDPKSAVGIIEDVYHEHPDFGQAATFFVLPAADPPDDLFGQKQYRTQKLEYLVAHGMTVGNHTYWHQDLATVDDAEVQRQIGQAIQYVHGILPGYPMDLMALPNGDWPKNKRLAIEGTWKDVTYRNRAIMLVGANPAPAPDSVKFDPLALPRIQGIQEQLDDWLDYLGKHRYVSDGNPDTITFPVQLAKDLRMTPAMRQVDSPSPAYEVIRLRG